MGMARTLCDGSLPPNRRQELFRAWRVTLLAPGGNEALSVLDRLACQMFLSLPVQQDGKPWTRTWGAPDGLCSVGLPSFDDINDAVSDLLFGVPLDETEDEAQTDWVVDLANMIVGHKNGTSRGPRSMFHTFCLPVVLTSGVFKIVFTCLITGDQGGLVGLVHASTGEPVLAFDIGGSLTASSLGVTAGALGRARINKFSRIQVPGWPVLGAPVHGHLHSSCHFTESAQRMMLIADVQGGTLSLLPSDMAHGVENGNICSDRSLVARLGPGAQSLRDTNIFFSFSDDFGEGFFDQTGLSSFVRIECILSV